MIRSRRVPDCSHASAAGHEISANRIKSRLKTITATGAYNPSHATNDLNMASSIRKPTPEAILKVAPHTSSVGVSSRLEFAALCRERYRSRMVRAMQNEISSKAVRYGNSVRYRQHEPAQTKPRLCNTDFPGSRRYFQNRRMAAFDSLLKGIRSRRPVGGSAAITFVLILRVLRVFLGFLRVVPFPQFYMK